MATVQERIEIPASADSVWQTVRDFGAIDEYVAPIDRATVDGRGVGAERTLTLADGGEVVERLEVRDDDARTLRYSIVDGPLPVEGYEGTMSVDPIDRSTCTVRWASTFEVGDGPEEEITSTFAELYAVGLGGLKERHAPNAA